MRSLFAFGDAISESTEWSYPKSSRQAESDKGVLSHSPHSVLVRVIGDLIARNDVNRKS